MGSELKIGVVGATGAVGKELLAVLDKAPWRPDTIEAYASPATHSSHVEYGERQLPVDDVGGGFGPLDLVFLCTPPDVARRFGEAAQADGIPVVDTSGAFADDEDVPLVLPWVNPMVLAENPLRATIALPSPGAMLLAAAVAPLVRADAVAHIDATILLPASAMGRKGVEELSAQVVALFNSGTPPRKVFPSGLAFDLLPSMGATEATGRTDLEDRVIIEVSELLGLRTAPTVDVIGVPVFSGVTASIRLALSKRVDLALVQRLLADGGVQIADEPRTLPRPRRVEGNPFATVGRLRMSPDGQRLDLLAGVDNLRGTAAAAAAAAAVLLRNAGALDGLSGGRGRPAEE